MYTFMSLPQISNATFRDNTAEFGGGLYNSVSSPSITESTFIGNIADRTGGGIYNRYSNPSVSESLFKHNRAKFGGAVANIGPYNGPAEFDSVTFVGNRARDGGALYNEIPREAVVGVGETFDSSDPRVATVMDCVFHGNGAERGGAMMNVRAHPYIANSIFSENEAALGAGIFNDAASPDVRHATFNANLAFAGPAMTSLNGSRAELWNSILWGDIAVLSMFLPFPELMEDSSSSTLIVTSTVQGHPFAQDPQFVNSALPAGPNGIWRDGDDGLRLRTGSPVIDSAITLADPKVQEDIRGMARPQLNGFDRGAYEMHSFELVTIGSSSLVINFAHSNSTSGDSATVRPVPDDLRLNTAKAESFSPSDKPVGSAPSRVALSDFVLERDQDWHGQLIDAAIKELLDPIIPNASRFSTPFSSLSDDLDAVLSSSVWSIESAQW